MDELTRRFEEALRAQGGEIVETLGDDAFRVRLPAGDAVISLENLRRDITRDGDGDAGDGDGGRHEAVDAFVAALGRAPRGLPGWPDARPGLRWALESRTLDLTDVVHEALTPQLAAVLCHVDDHEALASFVSPRTLEAWSLDRERARQHALENMAALLARTEIEVGEVRGAPLGMFSTPSIHKASLLLAPALKERVATAIGWPLLAVAPCRDFAYVFADESLIAPMAATVMREHQESGYPLTTEVLRIADDGLEAIGAFGPPPGD